MNILVTGGTGFIGTQVATRLIAGGHQVRVLSRGTKPTVSGAQWVRGSVLEEGTLAEALHGCDAVVHLVGIISEIGSQTFERMHIEATAKVVSAMRQNGVNRLVHMSALGARSNAPSRYHRTKAAAEALVRESGLAWTIFRPSLAYGRGDGFVTLFDRISRWSPIIPVFGSGTNQLQPLPVRTVAEAFSRALENIGTVSQIVDLVGPQPLSFREILRTLLLVRGRRRWLVSVPMPLARLQARLLETIFPTVFGAAPPLNRDQLLMLQEDNVGDPQQAERLMGISTVSFKQGLQGMFFD